GRVVGRKDHGGRGGKEDVNVATDEVSRQRWEEGDVPFCIAVLQDEVLPLDVSQLTQALLQGFVAAPLPDLLRTPGENPNTRDFPLLLGFGGERHREQAQDERDDAPNGAVPHGRLLQSTSCRAAASHTPEAQP